MSFLYVGKKVKIEIATQQLDPSRFAAWRPFDADRFELDVEGNVIFDSSDEAASQDILDYQVFPPTIAWRMQYGVNLSFTVPNGEARITGLTPLSQQIVGGPTVSLTFGGAGGSNTASWRYCTDYHFAKRLLTGEQVEMLKPFVGYPVLIGCAPLARSLQRNFPEWEAFPKAVKLKNLTSVFKGERLRVTRMWWQPGGGGFEDDFWRGIGQYMNPTPGAPRAADIASLANTRNMGLGARQIFFENVPIFDYGENVLYPTSGDDSNQLAPFVWLDPTSRPLHKFMVWFGDFNNGTIELLKANGDRLTQNDLADVSAIENQNIINEIARTGRSEDFKLFSRRFGLYADTALGENFTTGTGGFPYDLDPAFYCNALSSMVAITNPGRRDIDGTIQPEARNSDRANVKILFEANGIGPVRINYVPGIGERIDRSDFKQSHGELSFSELTPAVSDIITSRVLAPANHEIEVIVSDREAAGIPFTPHSIPRSEFPNLYVDDRPFYLSGIKELTNKTVVITGVTVQQQ